MGKRTASEADSKAAHEDRRLKRQRVVNSTERNSPRPAPTVEDVNNSRQLQKALLFEGQGTASGFRSGLNVFKRFLDSILYATDEYDLPRKRAILREYLDTQKGKRREDSDTEFLTNLFQAWSFAVETNFDMLLSQVTANLALLLKVLSTSPDFLEYGTLLCKAFVQSTVLRRLNRSLSAPPSKENIISPILRLLTEVTRFNEGAHAKAVYAKRDYTLDPKVLGRNITLWRDSNEDPDTEKRKPSIRVNAVRYLLAHLIHQDELAKAEILSNTNVSRAVLDHLQADPPFLVFEILDVMKNHVFLDKTIPRHVKSRVLTGKTLSHIASLYRHHTVEGSVPEGHKSSDVVAHEFLTLVCTSPAYGVMLPASGYYPAVNEGDEGEVVMEDSVDFANEFGIDPSEGAQGRGRIRNVILAEFLQSLRPYANLLQQELLVSILEACPELVADYFIQKESFNYDPKLTSTWIGYSSFLYRTIELPVPSNLNGRRSYKPYPPAASTILQSILPQPLTQQVLIKCLNSSSDLVNFFAVRVLTVAFQKLRLILTEYNTASLSQSSGLWEQGAARVLTEFGQRCPPMKTVILAFRRPAFQKDMMREAITRLLRLYFEVTPQVALQEKFDVSVPLCNALMLAEKRVDAPEDKAFRVMELEHWIQIARHSPSMRWWQKNKSLPHSPFVMLLKLVVTSTEGELYSGIKSLLTSILQDHEMLQMSSSPDALDALLASLCASCGSSSPLPQVLEFLDDCCARFIKAPIKYFDDLDNLRSDITQQNVTSGPLSPLLMVLLEQWPFKGGKPEKGNPAEPLAQWLSKLLYLFKLIGEDETLLTLIRDSFVSSADQAYHQVLKDSFLWKMGKEKAKEALKLATGAEFSGSERSSTSPIPPEQPVASAKEVTTVDMELPPEEDEKHTGLNRWRKKDIEESIDDGDIGELLLCLCSRHAEIRLQALSNIRQLLAMIEENSDSDLLQLRILLGEVLETARPMVESEPFPYVGGVFAARAVNVLADPMHFMFGKLNQFLLKRPNWTVENIPRYFGRNIINNEPDQDGSYHKEVDWYLDYLIECLRRSEDMEIFRTKNIFERLLSYYVSGSCAITAKEKIVRLLLRAAAVGGSTTLITRCGLVSWIQMRLDTNDHRHYMLRQLASRVWATCDKDKVREWSSDMAESNLAVMAKAKEVSSQA